MQTVSAISVIDLSNELLKRGAVQENQLSIISPSLPELIIQLREENLPTDILEKRLPEIHMKKLWQSVDQKTHPSIGLNIGSTVTPSSSGLLATWIANCRTLGDAFDIFSKNIYLLNPSEQWMINFIGDDVVFEFSFKDKMEYPDIAIDRSMVALISWAEYWTGKKIKILSAGFQRPKPENIDLLEQHFGKNIKFSLGKNFARIKKADLDLEILSRSAYLKSLLEKQVDLVKPLISDGTLKNKVISLLKKDLSKYSYADEVCNELHVSRSTLYRELKKESSSFSELLKEVRSFYYENARQQSMSAQEISDLLGYRDLSTYYKAKKRGSFC